MSDIYDLTDQFLGHFADDWYTIAIQRCRKTLIRDIPFRKEWKRIKKAIRTREFAPGEALKLVHEGANTVLDENTEEEAYVWLDKVVENIERTDGIIDEY